MDSPAPATFMRAYEMLQQLAALDEYGNITKLGLFNFHLLKFDLKPKLSVVRLKNGRVSFGTSARQDVDQQLQLQLLQRDPFNYSYALWFVNYIY